MKTKNETKQAQHTAEGGHTPGPWQYDETWALIKSDDGAEIAAVHAARAYRSPKSKDAFRDEPKANARLIAAAPELLEAAKVALGRFFVGNTPTLDEIATLKAAIAKAEGR